MNTFELTLVILLAVVNFPFVWTVNWIVHSKSVKKVYDVEVEGAQRQREIRNALLTTPIHAVLFALFLTSGALKSGQETFLTIPVTFLLTLVWTEIWHYVSHIAMHTRPLHFIHVEHHRSMATHPWTSVSFSLLEKLIFSAGILGFMSLLSHFMAVSVFGIFAYYIVYFFTNTLGHANFEFRKPGYYNTFMGQLFNSPSFHAMHHARYTKNYGLLTPILDRAFGTAWPDYKQVQTRAAEGKPLTKLNERLQ